MLSRFRPLRRFRAPYLFARRAVRRRASRRRARAIARAARGASRARRRVVGALCGAERRAGYPEPSTP